MTTASTLWRIHAPIPEFIVRGQANAITAKIYDASGDLTAPDSGTVTIYDDSNAKVIDGAAVTIASTRANYTIAAIDLPASKSLADGWRIEWDLVMSGDPFEFVRSAALVRSDLFPTVVEADLAARHQNISRLIASGNDADDFIAEAWFVILRLLLKGGRLPYLILSPYSLHDSLAFKSLELIFRDGHTAAGDGKFAELADFYREAFAQEWATISFDYDTGRDGQADAKIAAAPVVFTGGPGVETGRIQWP